MKKGRVLQNQAVSLCKILPAPLFQLIASGSLIYVLHFGKKSFLISFDSSTTFRIVLVFNFLKLIHQYLTKYALSGKIFLAGAMEVPCSREDPQKITCVSMLVFIFFLFLTDPLPVIFTLVLATFISKVQITIIRIIRIRKLSQPQLNLN